MEDYLEAFYLRLQDNEFEPDETKTKWRGRVAIDWENAENGEEESAVHTITIYLPEGFPYRSPIVISQDKPPLAPSWHLSATNPPTLCLWDSETGWQPDCTAHKLLNRICDWFYYYHTDTWPANSQVPDLHLYLNKVGTVLVGEDWLLPPDISSGRFTLWRSKQYGNAPDIATCSGDQNEPEHRLAANIILGQNPIRFRGAWFRVSHPFVPSNRLHGLLSQLDQLMHESSSWSLKKCIAAVGMKANKGFPIAVGYPDRLGQERWLFLWSQFPQGTGKRYRWSSRQKLRQIEIHSLQTAPASQDALLRRSAYLSHSLTSKRIALFGIGALGSSIALLLAKAGVGELRLIDSDELMPGNVMRHVCGLNYVGLLKREAVQSVIYRHNPDCYVEAYEATWEGNKLSDYINNCDLVIDATGHTNFSLYLNQLCVARKQPIAFVATYRRARVGRMIGRFDSDAPCLACYLNHRYAWSESEYPTIPADPDETFLEDGCGSVTEEAVALDVEAVANFATRQVIAFLDDTHNGRNLGLIVNESLLNATSDHLHTPGMHFWQNQAKANCSICGS